jgi:hypothetical protein
MLKQRETVALQTPASLATSEMVGMFDEIWMEGPHSILIGERYIYYLKPIQPSNRSLATADLPLM